MVAAEGYVLVCAMEKGPLELDFGQKGQITDALTGAKVGEGPLLTVAFRKGETRIFRKDAR